MTRQSPMRTRQSTSRSLSLFTPGGRGSIAKAAIFVSIREATESVSLSNSLAAEGLMMRRYSATSLPAAASQAASHHIKGNALLMGAALSHELIVNVFPQLAMKIEIDHDRDLLALLVGDEVNAFHRFSSRTQRSSHEMKSSAPARPGNLPASRASTHRGGARPTRGGTL